MLAHCGVDYLILSPQCLMVVCYIVMGLCIMNIKFIADHVKITSPSPVNDDVTITFKSGNVEK